MKNSKKIIIISAVLLVLIVVGILAYPFVFYRDFEKTLGFNRDEITGIRFMNGSTGLRAEVTDQADVDEFLDYFTGAKLKKHIDQRMRDGFTLSTALYAGDKQVVVFVCTSSNLITSGDTRYVMNKSLTKEQIDYIIEKYGMSRQ